MHVDTFDLGCGCNAALHLMSMRQSSQLSECSDFYLDANNVCDQSRAGIDNQECTKASWHLTLHGRADPDGLGKGSGGGGPGWNGPRKWSTTEYGLGASCIATTRPFQEEVGFPAVANCQLMAREIMPSQVARSGCKLKLAIEGYSEMVDSFAVLNVD